MSNSNVYTVILAGGGGTRLWPKSRIKTPKQFLRLTDNDTMMQLAANRLNKFVPWSNMIVVTNKIYKEEVAKQLPEIPKDQIIAEPEKRDTAMAMLVGAIYAKNLNPNAVVVNAASDHIVSDVDEFVRVMKAAVKVASNKKDLVTVGITPDYPTSAFGYIKIGQELKTLDRDLPLFKVDGFTEKPKIATARAYISTGKYFWNANMYVWASQALDDAFAKYKPKMFEQTRVLLSKTGKDFHQKLDTVYQDIESISIDYAISEQADNLVLIPGDFGWNDVGDWKVVFDLGQKNQEKNVIIGDHDKLDTLAVNSTGNLIHADKRLIALVEVDDLVIVDTPEILMIAPKSKSQSVKKIVEQLKNEEKLEYL